MALASKSVFLAKLYYLLLNGRFDGEVRATLAARSEFLRSSISKKYCESVLRRNVHRLEKGLIMRPQREVFAEAYIRETLDALLENVDTVDEETKGWSIDVIRRYFQVVDSTKSSVINDARAVFEERFERRPTEGGQMVPYVRKKGDLPTYDQILALAKYRRSVRWYVDEAVSRESITKAIQVASLSPSACNRLPYKFHVSNESSTASEILGCAGGTAGFAHNVPCAAILTGDLSCYEYETDRHLVYVDSSLAAMAFCFGLEVQGISSVCINWHDVGSRERKIRSIVNLRPSERIVMLIGFGYAEEGSLVPFSAKKSLNSLLEFV